MYNQLYIYQPEEALQARMNREENQHCRHNVMLTIQNTLDNINPYAMAYKNMHQIELEENNNAANEGRPVASTYRS